MNLRRLANGGMCSLSPCSADEPRAAPYWPAEPVRRRSPAVGPGHLDAVPHRRSAAVPVQRRHGVDGGVLPVQVGQDAVVVGQHLRRRAPVAAVGPDEHRRVRAQHVDLGAHALLGDPTVLVVPLLPFLPLVAAHPAVHQRDAHLVGHLDEAGGGDLGLQPQHVQAEILGVAQDRGVAVRVGLVEQVGGVGGPAHQEVLAVDLQVEVAAGAQVGEAVVAVAALGDGADAELRRGGVGDRAVLDEVQPQVVEVRPAHRVRPPQVGVADRQRGEAIGGEADLAFLAGLERDGLVDVDRGLAVAGDRCAQHAADPLGGVVAHAGVDGQPRAVGVGQWQLGVDGGRTDGDSAGCLEVHRFPDAGVAVGNERVSVGGILVRSLIAQIAPVDPVVPAVGQLDTVDVLDGSFGGDLDRQDVRLARLDPRGDVELVVVVHPDDLAVVGDAVAVEPDVGAVVDAGEVQQVGLLAGRRGERGPVPPVLLVEVLGDLGEQVLAVVQVGVDAVVLQRLQHGGRHPAHRMPGGVVVTGAGHRVAVGAELAGRLELPAAGQFDVLGGLRRGGLEHPEVTGADQQEHDDDDRSERLRHRRLTPRIDVATGQRRGRRPDVAGPSWQSRSRVVVSGLCGTRHPSPAEPVESHPNRLCADAAEACRRSTLTQ